MRDNENSASPAVSEVLALAKEVLETNREILPDSFPTLNDDSAWAMLPCGDTGFCRAGLIVNVHWPDRDNLSELLGRALLHSREGCKKKTRSVLFALRIEAEIWDGVWGLFAPAFKALSPRVETAVIRVPPPRRHFWEDAGNAYFHARDVLRGPFPEGEKAIATDAYYAYEYARNVLHGRFLLGEHAIAELAGHAYYYAHEVLKGARFVLGEKAISSYAQWAYLYARDVLRKSFREGEEAIAKDAYYSCEYALEVLRGAFLPGEAAIMSDPVCRLKYEKNIRGLN